ncbi:MAG: metallophosphoesterase family protein [Planctomycetota bacterium]|jgi:hypothetical protein|nr:metallophosphoesterase family protein [Planctomycetota bacterium]
MLGRCRRSKRVKRALVLFVIAALNVVAYSGVYNYPIRFWPKWNYSPSSQEALHESGREPDNLVLVAARDMSTMMTVSWRTSEDVSDGVVQCFPADANGLAETIEEPACSKLLFCDELKTDKTVYCHSATLANLRPGTTYWYRAGSPTENAWSEYRSFKTPEAKPDSFSFVFFGDTQVGFDAFSELLADVDERHPDVAFYMIGGDLVDRGEFRNLWDEFMTGSGFFFSRTPFAPVMGNHDFGKGDVGARLFNSYFPIPGSACRPTERAVNYSYQAGGVFFAVVNDPGAESGAEWLEGELAAAEEIGYDFKVVANHYPIFNVKPSRDDRTRQELWMPIFDKYGVGLVLSGHDHSYMRSRPIHADRRMGGDDSGTVYVVANASTKHNDFKRIDVAEAQFTDQSTYQVVTVTRDKDGKASLHYAAYDENGTLVDEIRFGERGKRFLRAESEQRNAFADMLAITLP